MSKRVSEEGRSTSARLTVPFGDRAKLSATDRRSLRGQEELAEPSFEMTTRYLHERAPNAAAKAVERALALGLDERRSRRRSCSPARP